MGRDDVMTRAQVEGMIADGSIIIIMDEMVLNLDNWIKFHPGGQLAIHHMVGRDSSDEIKAYHSEKTLRTMKAFRIGRKPAGPWTNYTPPIRGGLFHKNGGALVNPTPLPDVTTPHGSTLKLNNYSGDDVDKVSVGSGSSESGETRGSDSDAVNDRGSMASSITSDDGSVDEAEAETEAVAAKKGAARDEALATGLRKRAVAASSSSENGDEKDDGPFRHLSPAEYTNWAVDQQIEKDLSMYPAVDQATQLDITRKYNELHQKVKDMGYYNCPYSEYAKECARYLTLFGMCVGLLYKGWYLTSAMFLGMFWHQIMFTAHDAGHCAITGNFKIDALIAIFIADFCVGLSMGWWKSSHNVHHLITNMPEHDPDIQNLPIFATCPSFFKSLRSTYYNFVFVWDKAAEILLPYQAYAYYPIMAVARFNLYVLSWLHVLSNKSSDLNRTNAWWIRPTEVVFMACYWFLFGYCLVWRSLPDWWTRVGYVVVSHVCIMPLHIQINLSHWGMSHNDLGEEESFAQRQLRTTMDVDCPKWMDFYHGGLQFQAIHHLFPRVPRHNLRKVQVLVKEFCAETGIPYSILSFVDSNKKVLGRLDQIGEQVTMLVNCQKHMAEKNEMGFH